MHKRPGGPSMCPCHSCDQWNCVTTVPSTTPCRPCSWERRFLSVKGEFLYVRAYPTLIIIEV